MINFEKYLIKNAAFTEKYLKAYISKLKNAPQVLKDAMGYSLTAGGKRVRPVLLLAAAEAFGLRREHAAPAAAAVEMLHTYSLIHDDLPSMDNDSLRRGRPTNHMVYGEDTALLAGDGMLTYVFDVFSQTKNVPPQNVLAAINCLAKNAGPEGMVGGQTADVFAEGLIKNDLKRIKKLKNFKTKKLNYFLLPASVKNVSAQAVLKYIHMGKTAALIKASVECGALLAGAKGEALKNIRVYADNIGLVFQVADDILDVTATAKQLGKSNSDAQNGKLTYVTLFGLDYSKKYAAQLTTNAKKALDKIKGKNLEPLYAMADFFTTRTN